MGGRGGTWELPPFSGTAAEERRRGRLIRVNEPLSRSLKGNFFTAIMSVGTSDAMGKKRMCAMGKMSLMLRNKDANEGGFSLCLSSCRTEVPAEREECRLISRCSSMELQVLPASSFVRLCKSQWRPAEGLRVDETTEVNSSSIVSCKSGRCCDEVKLTLFKANFTPLLYGTSFLKIWRK